MNFRNNDYIVPRNRLLTYRFLICLTNLTGLGAKFADSLIKFGQESENYSSGIRFSDQKPFNILRLRFAKNCRKMYPDEKRTCRERIKFYTLLPWQLWLLKLFCPQRTLTVFSEKAQNKAIWMSEWILRMNFLSVFACRGTISTNRCFKIWILKLFKRNSFK